MRVLGIWAGFLFLCPRSHQLLSPSGASASFSQIGGSQRDEGESGRGKQGERGCGQILRLAGLQGDRAAGGSSGEGR